MGNQYATSANGYSPEEIQRGYERGKDVQDHHQKERGRYDTAYNAHQDKEKARVASLTGDALTKYNTQQDAKKARITKFHASNKAKQDAKNAARTKEKSTWTPEQHAAEKTRISEFHAKAKRDREAKKAREAAAYKALTPQERDIKAQKLKDFWTNVYADRAAKKGFKLGDALAASAPAPQQSQQTDNNRFAESDKFQQSQQSQQSQPTDNNRFAASNEFQQELNDTKNSYSGGKYTPMSNAEGSYSGGKYESNIEQDLNKGRQRVDTMINSNQYNRQVEREKAFKANSENTQNSIDFYKKYFFLNQDAQKGNSDGSQIASKYINKAAQSNPIDVVALDKHIRKGPMYHEAKSEVAGLLTYGDKYRNARENPLGWNQPSPMEGFKPPDFQSIYNKTKKDIDGINI